MPRVPRAFTQEEIETGLFAMIAWSGNASAAARKLKTDGKLDVSPSVLSGWKVTHAARYDEIRSKFSDEIEARLAHDMRETALLAKRVEILALEKAEQRLLAGDDPDPGKTASYLARVSQSSTDKLLSLTGRPTQITETRNLGEILRSLAAKGVIEIPAEAVSVRDADPAPDPLAASR